MSKPASEYTPEERRALYAATIRQVLQSMKPSAGKQYAGAQLAYAKGRAWRLMQAQGF